MRRSIILTVIAGFVMASSGSLASEAQNANSSASLERNLRIFTVVAALNAAGFDVELASDYHPVRRQVREELESLDPGLVARLEAFFEEHRADGPEEDELSRYVALALSLRDPPEMTLATEGMFTPPEARELVDFAPLVSEFYREADIIQLWTRLAPAYNAELDRMIPPLRRMVEQANAYLRELPGPRDGRRMVAYLELTAPVNSVHIKNYPDNLYLVLGPSAEIPESDVRHAYLHLVLDPIVARSRAELRRSEDMLDWLDAADDVSGEHVDDFEIMVIESLIRAVEVRIDELGEEEANAAIAAGYRSGRLLLPFFVDQLKDYETRPAGMARHFEYIVRELDLEDERERFDTTFFAIDPPQTIVARAVVPPPVRQPDPIRSRLAAGQQAFNSGDDVAARQAFEDVLDQTGGENGPALYGMGLLASREGDPEAATDYFLRTIESDSADAGMKTWSHIFLGRIQDIGCQREAAMERYRAALEIGDNTNNAREAAESGLAGPYGGGC